MMLILVFVYFSRLNATFVLHQISEVLQLQYVFSYLCTAHFVKCLTFTVWELNLEAD